MEVILISEGRMKIMLTAEDMREFAIDCDAAQDPDLRRRFKDVLRRADEASGTDMSTARVMISLFCSRGGGCELFVTRLPSSPPSEAGEERGVLYLFATIGAMIAACRLLAARGYGEDSSAFRTDAGEYALLLTELSGDAPLPLPAACLDEYGERLRSGDERMLICARANSLCAESAIKLLSKF